MIEDKEQIGKKLLNDAIEVSKKVEEDLKNKMEKQREKYERVIDKKIGIIKRYKERLKKAYELKPHLLNKKIYQHQNSIKKLLEEIDKLEKERDTFKRLYWKFNPCVDYKSAQKNQKRLEKNKLSSHKKGEEK